MVKSDEFGRCDNYMLSLHGFGRTVMKRVVDRTIKRKHKQISSLMRQHI